MQADGRVIARLTKLIPELEYARETHVCWSTTTDAALAANPQIGSREFHRGCIAEYDERLAAIREAITELLAIAEAVEDLRADAIEYEFEVWQDDAMQAGGTTTTLEAAIGEADHYAVMYGQDGPVEVRYYERRAISDAALSTVAPVRD